MSFPELIVDSKIFKKDLKVLDVGTGGFCGRNTLDQYINLIDYKNIYCIEYNKERYENLCKKYINKYKDIKFYLGDFFNYDFNTVFNIVICDLDSSIFLNRFDEEINKAESLISKNGYIIIMALGDLNNIKTLTCDTKIINEYTDSYKNIWKTNNITDKIIQNKINKNLKVINSFDHTNFTRYVLIQKLN